MSPPITSVECACRFFVGDMTREQGQRTGVPWGQELRGLGHQHTNGRTRLHLCTVGGNEPGDRFVARGFENLSRQLHRRRPLCRLADRMRGHSHACWHPEHDAQGALRQRHCPIIPLHVVSVSGKRRIIFLLEGPARAHRSHTAWRPWRGWRLRRRFRFCRRCARTVALHVGPLLLELVKHECVWVTRLLFQNMLNETLDPALELMAVDVVSGQADLVLYRCRA
mmetsp:Transcript_53617/g.149167  ORF Transcript_53617/g.149167 Transcript_53617/m.149167 type:complete len:224 (+) Transcript_53617:331-1002(+)